MDLVFLILELLEKYLEQQWLLKRLSICPDIPTKLFVFSDDMDGLRKVPKNIPNQNLIKVKI